MKFTEKLKRLHARAEYADEALDRHQIDPIFWNQRIEARDSFLVNSIPQIIEALEAAEKLCPSHHLPLINGWAHRTNVRKTHRRQIPDGLRHKLDALDALVEEPKP